MSKPIALWKKILVIPAIVEARQRARAAAEAAARDAVTKAVPRLVPLATGALEGFANAVPARCTKHGILGCPVCAAKGR